MTSGSPHQERAVAGSRALRRVLAASFLDESGLKAVLRAARLPLAPGARVVLLHVTPPWSMRSRPPVSDKDARRALERAAAAGRDAARSAGNEDPDFVPIVAGGWPAEEIVRFAWQERSELIVVGPPAARIDGSTRATISRVMRHADLPLLVARGNPWQEYRSVLCAVDRSVTAVDTIAVAVRLSTPAARSFNLFHAYHIPFEGWIGSDVPELEHDAVAYVRALAREVADDVAVTSTVVRHGDRCIEILRAAVDLCADLVVLGTHGRSGISRAVHGSVAEWVITNSLFDVAVARSHRATLERR